MEEGKSTNEVAQHSINPKRCSSVNRVITCSEGLVDTEFCDKIEYYKYCQIPNN